MTASLRGSAMQTADKIIYSFCILLIAVVVAGTVL
jgi:hypothetical protein